MTKKLNNVQVAALVFALTEGQVGPGCKSWGLTGSITSVTNEAIGRLLDDGLAMLAYDKSEANCEVWVFLTAKGDTEARRLFKETRKKEWSRPSKNIASTDQ